MPYRFIAACDRYEGRPSTYRYVVTVGPVAVTSIRKLSAVCDFGPGFDIFIGSVTHGPSSIVCRHVTVGQECI